MPKDSLRKLLDEFPYFFNKSETSNFVKSQSVTNDRFKEVYQTLFDVYHSFHLNKRILIWKEQEVPYDYQMNFVVNFDNLKSVKVIKNDEVIYMEEYIYDDFVDYFEYTYDGNTEDDVVDETADIPIIPTAQFIVEAETWNEETIRKGFPENDEILRDENGKYVPDVYDHDFSLDEIGALNNIPRKQYIYTTDYDNTEPPYNDRFTEDDYHYMKRQIEYNIRLHSDYRPVLELWKLYGVDAEMTNRERILAKMFDITKHPHHQETKINPCNGKPYDILIVDEWVPEKWEHRDKFCDLDLMLGEYLLVRADILNPVIKQPVYFTFDFVNSLAKSIWDEDYCIDIYLNGELIEEGWTSPNWKCLSDWMEYGDNLFHFVGRREDIIVDEVELTVYVRGCDDADFYVNEVTGNDSNDGSKTRPFKTLEKAISCLNGVYDLIAICGTVHTEGHIPVKYKGILLGCKTPLIINTNDEYFFEVLQGIKLTMVDVNVSGGYYSGLADYIVYEDNNGIPHIEQAIIYNINNGVLIDDLYLPDNFIKNIQLDTQTGILSWDEYNKNEFTKLSNFEGVITDLKTCENGLCYNEAEVYELEQYLLDGEFVFFEDREDLVGAVSNLTWSSTTGSFEYDALTDVEILYTARYHELED